MLIFFFQYITNFRQQHFFLTQYGRWQEAAAFPLFLSVSLVISLINIKIEKAIMRKSKAGLQEIS